MPNWIKGVLKVRGDFENVKKLLSEEVKAYHYSVINAGGYATEEIDNGFKCEECDDNYYEVSYDIESTAWLYFKGSDRAFVDDTEDIVIILDDHKAVTSVHIRQAWEFMYEYWVELSKKYNVDLRLYGVEQGMMFTEEVEIKDGKIILNNGKKYESFSEFIWKVPFCDMGG